MTQPASTDSPSRQQHLPVPILVLAAWLAPGLGYVLLGQRARGLTAGIAILLLFALGLLIGGMKVVDPFTSYSLHGVLQKPAYMGQVLTGPVAIVCGRVAADSSFATSHARLNEIGTLYTAVAGMLNLLVIIDTASRAAAPRETP